LRIITTTLALAITTRVLVDVAVALVVIHVTDSGGVLLTGGMPHPKPTDMDMTKHSDYFVCKDTSERTAQRCDYTVDKKRANSCVLKQLFLEGVEQPKISPTKPANVSLAVLKR